MGLIIIAILVLALIGYARNKQPKSNNGEFASISCIASFFGSGFCLSGGLRATNISVAVKNALIVGPSGSGKSSTVLAGSINSLARGNSSMCVFDVAGELYKLFSGYLAKIGYKVYCIDFSKYSDALNPILYCNTISDILKLAFLLIRNSGIESKNDIYWSASAEQMLGIFIEYMVFFIPKEKRHFASLIKLIDQFAATPSKIDQLIVRTGNESLITRYKAMNAVSEKTLQSTLSMVRTALKVFCTPELQYCTSKNSFDFANFRKEKSVLFICTPINDSCYFASYSALLFEAFFKEIFSRISEKKELYLFALLDEMVLMHFQNLGQVFSLCRKHRAGCLGVVQDEKMLQMCYSPAEAHAIQTNSFCKVYLPGQPLSTCKNLEETFGRYTYIDDKGIERSKQMMSASDIRMCKDALILCGSEPPIRAKLKPFYSNFILRRRTSFPPFDRTGNVQSEIQTISFDED